MEELDHAGIGGAPVGQLLGAGGFGVGVGGGTKDADEELHGDQLAGVAVNQVGTFAGEINEHLLAGTVALAHRGRESLTPPPVQLAELAVAVAFGVDLTVLQPQQMQGDAGALELAVDGGPLGERSGGAGDLGELEQAFLERGVVELRWQWPGEPSLTGTGDIGRDGARSDRAGFGDLAMGKPSLVLELEDMT